jgi:nucleoside-diphosphate-sugar epimerase
MVTSAVSEKMPLGLAPDRPGKSIAVRVVVTGATGNVGSSVVSSLAADPAIEAIVGVARRRPSVRPPKVTWLAADLATDPLDGVVRGADVVVHLAWMIQPQRDHLTLMRTNIVGTMRLFGAAARERVPAFVYASSVGTYAPGPKDRLVDESWPATGIRTSVYSRHKAAIEALLDDAESSYRDMRIVRMRTSLVFQRPAASEIGRLFFGPAVPRSLLRPGRLPVVPRVPGLLFQATHADDIAAAYHAAVVRDVRGPFNVAADPVIDPTVLAEALQARQVPIPAALLRAAVAAGWRARVIPIEPGWIDMALQTPLMDASRARAELSWAPRVASTDALRELFDALADHAGGPTPPLVPSGGGPAEPALTRA